MIVRSQRLAALAADCMRVIDRAEEAGVTIDDGNVVDLCADNSAASLSEIRAALVIAGYSSRFPRATAGAAAVAAAAALSDLADPSERADADSVAELDDVGAMVDADWGDA